MIDIKANTQEEVDLLLELTLVGLKYADMPYCFSSGEGVEKGISMYYHTIYLLENLSDMENVT